MEVWKIIFLSKWVICRFHVNLPGCICWDGIQKGMSDLVDSWLHLPSRANLTYPIQFGSWEDDFPGSQWWDMASFPGGLAMFASQLVDK